MNTAKKRRHNEPIFFSEITENISPPVTVIKTDEEGYEYEEFVRGELRTESMVNMKVHNPDTSPVVRLYGTQGFNPKNGDNTVKVERYDMWKNWESMGTKQEPV